AGMMGAVSTGVGTRRDNRAIMVRTSSAESRINAYIAPCRCVLDESDGNLAVWLNDARQGNTIHATELRWFLFDADSGTYSVYFVAFPDSWTQAAKDTEDHVYPINSNWFKVLQTYQSAGWTCSIPLVDGLNSITVTKDVSNSALDSTHFAFDLAFQTSSGSITSSLSSTIYAHRLPAS
ncbi:MAG TPA: hypothetical protein VG711_00820, partial [Phycisphaerales bacterium]|nr:hypothetical protein [Phycisphaerales bacterium]